MNDDNVRVRHAHDMHALWQVCAQSHMQHTMLNTPPAHTHSPENGVVHHIFSDERHGRGTDQCVEGWAPPHPPVETLPC
jgi:hypothetical protein